MSGLIYLASPYWHESPQVRARRAHDVTFAAAWYTRHKREAIYSPIAYNVMLKGLVDMDHIDHQGWLELDAPFLRRASTVIVLKLDGWEQSRGIKWELEMARQLYIPVLHYHPAMMGLTEEREYELRPSA